MASLNPYDRDNASAESKPSFEARSGRYRPTQKADYFYKGFKGQNKRTGQLKLNQVFRNGLSKIEDFY